MRLVSCRCSLCAVCKALFVIFNVVPIVYLAVLGFLRVPSLLGLSDATRPNRKVRWNMEILSYFKEKNIGTTQGITDGSISDIVLPVPVKQLEEMQYYTRGKPYRDKVLILTPVNNAADDLEQFAKTLLNLTYPARLLSVYFGEDSSVDETVVAANFIKAKLERKFRRVDVIQLNLTGQLYGRNNVKHKQHVQFARRQHMAKARNQLFQSAFKDEKWVLWIDSDVREMPSNIIELLFSAEKEIVVPLCVQKDRFSHITRVYDKNSWRETPASLRRMRNAPHSELFLEGYSKTDRLYLHSLRPEGRIVELDGVGACVLLIKAKCHISGLIFPDYVFEHHIESEGLAKMAIRQGYGVYGMPFLEVTHK